MSITTIILIITIIPSLYFIQKQDELHKVLLNPYRVKHEKKWYLFITHAFVHADFMHLAINMYVFWMFGSFIEEILGSLPFLILYFGGILVASIPSFFKHQNNPNYNSLGASGAVASVVFAFVLINPASYLYLMAIIPMPAWVFGILYLVYEAYMDKKSSDRIAHDAHFYGAVWGILFTGFLHPELFSTFFDKIF